MPLKGAHIMATADITQRLVRELEQAFDATSAPLTRGAVVLTVRKPTATRSETTRLLRDIKNRLGLVTQGRSKFPAANPVENATEYYLATKREGDMIGIFLAGSADAPLIEVHFS